MSSKYVESLLTKQQEFPRKEKNKVVLIQEVNEENAHEKLAAENPIIVGKSESDDTSLHALKEGTKYVRTYDGCSEGGPT